MLMIVQLSVALTVLGAVAVPTDVVKSAGDSVQLNIQDPVQEFDELSWTFNRTNTVLKYYNETKRTRLYDDYKDRVEFNDKTYSLILKNLQKTDSGLYEAKTSGNKNTDLAGYSLSVLDKVNQQNTGFKILWIVGVAVFVLLVGIGYILHRCRKNFKGTRQSDDTVYAEVETIGGATQHMALETHCTVYSVIQKKPQPPSTRVQEQTTGEPEHDV